MDKYIDYKEYIEILRKNHGPVPFNYFTSTDCKYPNKNNKRTNDGLYVHHCREDKCIRLGTTEVAKTKPFDFQKPENLVYCNLYEHFLLHQKLILDGYCPEQPGNKDKLEGVIEYIIPTLCYHFIGKQYKMSYRKKEQQIVQKYRSEFIIEFARLYKYIISSINKNAVEMRERFKRMNFSIDFPAFILQEKPYVKEARLNNAKWLQENTLTEQQKLALNKLMDEIKNEINNYGKNKQI